MPSTYGAEGVELSSVMTSALAAVENAGPNILDRPSFSGWYSEIMEEAKNSMGFPTGKISAEKFIERVQEVADKVKEDEDIPIHSSLIS